MDDLLRVDTVSKRFGSFAALQQLSLSVRRGEFVSLLGPSGCGKTTLLRLIAGLMKVDEGTVLVDGRNVTSLPPHKRNIGVVFQSYALFPHLSVVDNIAFGLRAQRKCKAEIGAEVERALSLVQLGDHAMKPVTALSGGQRQRVALARALAVKPSLLLLDEPLSALDRKLRETMRVELRRILRHQNITSIFVTHDQEEALTISDRVAVMNKGFIEQYDTPRNIYDRPGSAFVLEFVGLSTRLHGTVVAAGNGQIQVETKYGRLAANSDLKPKAEVLLAVRPERMAVDRHERPDHNLIKARLADVTFTGSKIQLLLQSSGEDTVVAEVNPGSAEFPQSGLEMSLSWPRCETLVFEKGATKT
ncbi:MAG: ABC transporter ATP-binding protein [Parvibaculaceae bacterium]